MKIKSTQERILNRKTSSQPHHSISLWIVRERESINEQQQPRPISFLRETLSGRQGWNFDFLCALERFEGNIVFSDGNTFHTTYTYIELSIQYISHFLHATIYIHWAWSCPVHSVLHQNKTRMVTTTMISARVCIFDVFYEKWHLRKRRRAFYRTHSSDCNANLNVSALLCIQRLKPHCQPSWRMGCLDTSR